MPTLLRLKSRVLAAEEGRWRARRYNADTRVRAGLRGGWQGASRNGGLQRGVSTSFLYLSTSFKMREVCLDPRRQFSSYRREYAGARGGSRVYPPFPVLTRSAGAPSSHWLYSIWLTRSWNMSKNIIKIGTGKLQETQSKCKYTENERIFAVLLHPWWFFAVLVRHNCAMKDLLVRVEYF